MDAVAPPGKPPVESDHGQGGVPTRPAQTGSAPPRRTPAASNPKDGAGTQTAVPGPIRMQVFVGVTDSWGRTAREELVGG